MHDWCLKRRTSLSTFDPNARRLLVIDRLRDEDTRISRFSLINSRKLRFAVYKDACLVCALFWPAATNAELSLKATDQFRKWCSSCSPKPRNKPLRCSGGTILHRENSQHLAISHPRPAVHRLFAQAFSFSRFWSLLRPLARARGKKRDGKSQFSSSIRCGVLDRRKP